MAIPLSNPNLTPQQIQDFKNLATQLQLAGKNADVFADALNKAGGNTAKIAQELQGMEGYVNGLTNATNKFNVTLNDSLNLAKAIVDELKRQEGPIVRAKKAMSGLVSIGQQLVDEERELSSISEKRLKDIAREASTKLKNFQIEAQNVAGNLSVQAKIVDNEKKLFRINQLTNQAQINASRKLKQKLQDELNILNAFDKQDESYRAIQEHAEKRYKLEQATTKTFGLTGAALSAASSIASKFGMSHVQDQIEDINSKLREEMRKEIELNGDKALGFGRRFVYASKAIGETTAALAKGMLDPLFIMGKIYSAFLDVNKAAVDYKRLTGQNATATAGMNDSLATSAQVLELMAELTRQTGIAAGAIFSPEDLGRLAEAQNLLGLSAEQAGNLGIRSKLAGKSIESYEEGIVKSTNNYNALNNTAISHGVVMQDVLNTSDDIALSLGNSDEAITKAAASARGLGLSLEKVDDIANSLMDFETSIGYELEAQLLTGKDINLAKAREYALTNNLAGLSEELKNNGASAAEFANMGRVAQEGLAKALGMSRTELAKSIMMQETAKNLTNDQRAAAMGVSLAQLESMDIQDKINQSLAKLAQAFAPILDAMLPIVEAVVAVIGPVAKMVASLSGGIAPFIKYLTIGYGVLKGMQATYGIIAAFQTRMNASQVIQLGLGGKILAGLGFQSAAKAYQNTLQQRGTALTAVRAGLEQTVLGSILKQGYQMVMNIGRFVITNTLAAANALTQGTILSSIIAQGAGILKNIAQLGVQLVVNLANAAAALTANAALTFGVGVAVAVGAALAGYAAIKAITGDDVLSSPPGYGKRTLMGPEGAIALNDKDTIVAGTDLFGSRSNKQESTQLGSTVNMSPLVQEMQGLRTEMRMLVELARKGTVVMLDGKVLATSNTNNQKQVGSNLG